MATASQSARHKAYVKRAKAEGREPLTFSQWNWRDRNLAKARKGKAQGTTAVAAVKATTRKATKAQRINDAIERVNGRVVHRVDLSEVKNGLCITLDQADVKVALKALQGYKVRHAQGEGYVSKRGPRERLYTASSNVPNMRKALVSAGLQPTF